MIWDGDCGFCRRGVRWLEQRTGPRVATVPYQEYPFPEGDERITPASCARAVHLVESDGSVTRGAAAGVGALGRAPGWGWLPAPRASTPRWIRP